MTDRRARVATALRRGVLPLAAVSISISTAIGACGDSGTAQRPSVVPYGDVEQGRQAIENHGCGSCHTIPGVDGANALVGPPLVKWSLRGYIAGELVNSPDNLKRWIMDPQGVEPGTDMPDLGVSEQDAEDMVAYLYTLR
jgi:cytochrome c2